MRVADVNDNSPKFSDTTYFGSVIEMAELNSVVMIVFAIDEDQKVKKLKIACRFIIPFPKT